MAQLGAIPPPLFWAFPPLGEHAKWRCEPPPPPHKRGIPAILERYPMKTGKTRRASTGNDFWELSGIRTKAYHWGQDYYIPLFSFWGIVVDNYCRKLYRMVFLGGINHCNVTIGAVLPCKERIFRMQLQYFSLCYVGFNFFNETRFSTGFYLSEYNIRVHA